MLHVVKATLSLTLEDVMTVQRLLNGAWSISAIINGHLFTRTYYGYTKREAVEMFKGFLRSDFKS